MRVWRISQHADLSGKGGLYARGRWNYLNTLIVYCTDHPSTALLEMLVRFDFEDAPNTYQLLELDVPDEVAITRPDLPDNWQEDEDVTRTIWQAFCDANDNAVLEVPSVLMPQASNFLLNPRHANHSLIRVVSTHQNFLDERFFS